MSQKMNAIGYTKYLPISDAKSLFSFETELKTTQPHDLVVKVEAVSVNPVDVFTRRGQKTTLPEPNVIGYDAYGTVEAVGSETSLFQKGDHVFYAGSYIRPGSDSEYQLVDERIVGHAPKSLTPKESAAMPLTSLTAWECLFEQLEIDFNAYKNNQSKSILIINGSGGVGSVATQLANLAGLQVIATAGNEKSKKWEVQHGAKYVVDYHHDLIKQIHQLGFEYVDYILDLKNLDAYWSIITKLIAPFGHIASITGSGKDMNFAPLKQKAVTFAWEWMFAKSYFETPNMITQHEILDKISNLLDEGKLKNTLTKSFTPINAENLRKATTLVENGHMIGKVTVNNK